MREQRSEKCFLLLRMTRSGPFQHDVYIGSLLRDADLKPCKRASMLKYEGEMTLLFARPRRIDDVSREQRK